MSGGAFHLQRRVTFAETDMAGVMHFSNYYRWMEEVEHAFWRSIGLSVCGMEGDQHISWPRARTSCEYLQPARFEDQLDLTLRITRIGNKSIEFTVDFDRAGHRIAQGATVAVCCAIDRGGKFRSIEIPEPLRRKLQSAAGSVVQE